MKDRLFIGVYPAGIVYADRQREQHGDYKRLGFLSYYTLELKTLPDCPTDLRERIRAHAAGLIAKRCEKHTISACGQYVILGEF